jgi:hypothetical protein
MIRMTLSFYYEVLMKFYVFSLQKIGNFTVEIFQRFIFPIPGYPILLPESQTVASCWKQKKIPSQT